MTTNPEQTIRFTIDSTHEGWFRWVERVDFTKNSGYAFVGTFLPKGQQFEIPIKCVIVRKQPTGEGKYKQQGSAYVPSLQEDGTWALDEFFYTEDWFANILDLRDAVHEKLVELGIADTGQSETIEQLTQRRDELLAEIKKIDQALAEKLSLYPSRSGRLIRIDEDEI